MNIIPLSEYDSSPAAIIQPSPPHMLRPAPDRAVICFFYELFDALLAEGRLVEIGWDTSEMGRHPLYLYSAETPTGPRELLVFHPGVGAPLAVGLTEAVISLGIRRLIACGGCGVLNPEITAGHPVILTSAVRDEGTSFHYLPPGRESYPHPKGLAALEASCQAAGIDYRKGKSWTTDAFYRETPLRRESRMREGCDVVEMEASAFFAMAAFREVIFGQIVYGGDLVVPEGWDDRAWDKRHDDRRLMFRLAVDACLRL